MKRSNIMNTKPLVVKPESTHPVLDVIGIKMDVLVSAQDSHTQQITLQSGHEGVGPPPHHHAWDESFYVTRGQVQFTCDGNVTMCRAGTLVYIPANTVHAFSFGPGGGEMLEITGTGSQAIAMFSALGREIPPGPPDVAKVLQVASAYGVTFHL
jgi:mannose-6-phosphate isomerase-like protein (cupin superfamily)